MRLSFLHMYILFAGLIYGQNSINSTSTGESIPRSQILSTLLANTTYITAFPSCGCISTYLWSWLRRLQKITLIVKEQGQPLCRRALPFRAIPSLRARPQLRPLQQRLQVWRQE